MSYRLVFIHRINRINDIRSIGDMLLMIFIDTFYGFT